MHKIRFSTLEVPSHQAHFHLTRLREGHATFPHRHDFYEAFLVLEGEGSHHLNGRCLPLVKGDLVGIRPEDTHWFSTNKEQCLVFSNLAVSAELWQSFHTVLGLEAWLRESLEVTLHPAESQRLAHELEDLGKSDDPLALLRVLDRIREHLTQPRHHADSPPAWLEALRREMAERAETLVEPLGYWQKRSGRSPEHLARSCRRYYGITFSELLNRARIERAKFLLRHTDEKVTTIAFDCGYGNLANFHRVFARLTGRTPNAWRRLGRATVPL